VKPFKSFSWTCLRHVLAIVLSSASLLNAGEFVPPANNRLDINFNANWLYVQGDVASAQLQAFNDSGWTSVGLPHTTKFVSPENITAYLGVSWYRKHFTMTNAYAGRKVFIEFGAAMQAASVYINGTLVTQHVGGYTPFTVDATALVNYGGADNVIAVRLDSTPNSNFAPGNSNPDFQYHGGLYRDVNIHVTDPMHVTDAVYAGRTAGGGIFVTYPSVTNSSATADVRTDVQNESGSAQNATVVSTLADANSNIVVSATNTVSIPAGANYTFDQTMVVASPNLWHPHQPYLYSLHTVVQEGTTTVDYLKTQIGIRTIQWTHNNGLLINGTRFKGLGTNLHQDIYGEGNAMPDRTVYYDVKRLKDAGFDFVRSCHYPHNTAFYDACDQLGVLAMDSIPGWQCYNDTATFRNNTYQDCRDMIRRDRNHPSIVVWETSLNESSFTTAWATNIYAIAHAEYPGNQAFTAGWITTIFDLLCSSSQAGVRSSTDTRPIIIDEYGDWDYGGNSSTSRVSREDPDTNLLVQCDNWEQSLNNDLALSWFSTDAVWDFTDYTGYLTTTTKCGVMDNYRLPKFSYYYYQSQRDPSVAISNVQTGPMVYIANTHQANSPDAIRVFSNCQQVSLFTNGIFFAKQSPDTSYPNIPHPPFTFNLTSYVNGTIRADGLTNGVVACSFSRMPPGAPSQIVLKAEGMDLLCADGGDARLVFVSVVDANGQVVPNATNTVNLSVSGHGRILGPPAIVMKGGQLAAWLQAGRVAGTVTLTASGTGLTPAALTLTNRAVPDIDPLPAPAAPQNLTASGSTSVTLNWSPAPFAFTYDVKASTNNGGTYIVIATNISTTSYTLAANGTSYYVVSAVNEAGVESTNSAPASVLPPSYFAKLTNPGFELPGSGKIQSGFGNIPGWLNSGTTYNDTGAQSGGHSGLWEGYEQSSDDGAYQIVGSYQIQTGDRFTLTWCSQGEWNGGNTFSGTGANDPLQTVMLLRADATNTAFASMVSLAVQTNGMASGTWIQYTLTHTAAVADAGKYIGVSFATANNSGKSSGTWAGYDDFNLAVVSIPFPPGGLAASAGDGQAVLTWNPVANASGYNVQRSLTSGASYLVIAENLASTTFTNIGLTDGTNYYYVVSATNAAGEGANSTEVSALPLPPLPAVPTGLSALAANGTIWLNWNSSANATGYNVFRSQIAGGFDTKLASNVSSTTYTDTNVTPGVTYYYSLTATNPAGQSDFSGQASATLSPATLPTFGTITISGTNLLVSGTNGTAGMNYLMLTSSNLTSPLTNWSVLATNTFGPGGGFNTTNPLNPDSPQQFYRIKIP
jgi:fibronectin type 3 domain-containing protein